MLEGTSKHKKIHNKLNPEAGMNKIGKGNLVIPKQVFGANEGGMIVYSVTDIDIEKNRAFIAKKCIIRSKEAINNEKASKSQVKSKWIDLDKIKILHNPEDRINLLDGYDYYQIITFIDSCLIIGVNKETNKFFNDFNTSIEILYAAISFDTIQYQIPKMIKEKSPAYVWKKIYSMIKKDAKWWQEEPYREFYPRLRTGINNRANEKRKFIKDLMKRHHSS